MAGDWIKMRTDLADDPAVISMADRLGLDEFSVVGRLHHLWGWADAQSHDGHALGVTKKWIDRYVRCDGFADAMIFVSWLALTVDGVAFPRFGRHNGKTAKTRALAGDRKRRERASVTPEGGQVSRTQRDEPVTREEKRREDTKTSGTNTARSKPHAHEAFEGTTAGALCKTLRSMGVQCQPAHPSIIELVEQGVPAATVIAAAADARKAKPGEPISLGYVIAILKRWKDDARRMDVSGAQVPSRAISARDESRAAAAASIGLGAVPHDAQHDFIDVECRALE